MHCYPDEWYTDFQLSAEVIIAVVVSNERSNQTLTYSTKAVEAGRVTYSTNAVEADPDVLIVAHSKSTLPMNSNKPVGSDVTSRPATYFIKILKNVSCEWDRWVVETELCKLRGTQDTLIGRACAMFHL